ncbi:hypothetical protein BZA77DRAFT_125143 [Pyronema omphalodes]|nr:hypothetical protein BZA77DRAFT_125143 [Pyronema omphalodes]
MVKQKSSKPNRTITATHLYMEGQKNFAFLICILQFSFFRIHLLQRNDTATLLIRVTLTLLSPAILCSPQLSSALLFSPLLSSPLYFRLHRSSSHRSSLLHYSLLCSVSLISAPLLSASLTSR